MHFSIPDTQDLKDGSGSSFTAFNLHINGVYHCSVRYRQLHNFYEQLKKEFGAGTLPAFPPKKLLSLNTLQLEERRLLLERFVQIISQDQQISNSDIFNGFLLSAQQESQQETPENVSLDVYLMNGRKVTVSILSTDQTDMVLESVASQMELSEDYVYYFGLYLVKKEDDGDSSIVRKLQEFESPYISLKAACRNTTHRIVIRKSYWDVAYDDDVMNDRTAMNLLYVQAVSDLDREWVMAAPEQHRQLAALQHKDSKKEYLQLCRTLRFYGFVQFKPCTTDYPQQNCRVLITAGNKELVYRIQVHNDQMKEVVFKVTRMRCWRITTTLPQSNGENENNSEQPKLELSFEYLVAKDTLRWINAVSDQAILISMCLQGMVDELIMKRQGKRIRKPSTRNRSPKTRNFLKRDGSSQPNSPTTESPAKDIPQHNQKIKDTSVKKLSGKMSAVSIRSRTVNGIGLTENDAFDDGIGDDDL